LIFPFGADCGGMAMEEVEKELKELLELMKTVVTDHQVPRNIRELLKMQWKRFQSKK